MSISILIQQLAERRPDVFKAIENTILSDTDACEVGRLLVAGLRDEIDHQLEREKTDRFRINNLLEMDTHARNTRRRLKDDLRDLRFKYNNARKYDSHIPDRV